MGVATSGSPYAEINAEGDLGRLQEALIGAADLIQ
jgi:hypothetical protein